MADVETNPETFNDPEDSAVIHIPHSPTAEQLKKQRTQQYLDRLKTFTVLNYFAIPICISPLICAITGYQVFPGRKRSDSTNLQCVSCKAIVSILIPGNLSTKSTKTLALKYQQQLWTNHRESCSFRKEAEYLFRAQSKLIVPTPFARVLPAINSSLELVEQMEPMGLFRSRYMSMYEVLETKDVSTISIPVNVLQNLADDEKSLLDRILNLLHVEDAKHNEKQAISAVAMVLLGWDLGIDKDCVECVFCNSRQNFSNTVEDSSGTGTSSTKRKRQNSRWNEPVAAHRYYCPWICGFPKDNDFTPPLWQVLADRLLKITTDSSDAANFEVLRLLRASVSHKKLKNTKH